MTTGNGAAERPQSADIPLNIRRSSFGTLRVMRLLVDTIDYDGSAGNMAIQWRLAGFGELAAEVAP